MKNLTTPKLLQHSRFAIDDTVVFTGGSILGYPADAGIAAGDYRAKIIVPDVPIEGYATFKAEVANAAKYHPVCN